jgi:hypothetical protein
MFPAVKLVKIEVDNSLPHVGKSVYVPLYCKCGKLLYRQSLGRLPYCIKCGTQNQPGHVVI